MKRGSRYVIHENPATLYTIHKVTDGWITDDIEDSFNIPEPNDYNIEDALSTAWNRAGKEFSRRHGHSPTGNHRIYMKLVYINDWSPSKGATTQRYSRKYYSRRIYKIKQIPVRYERNGKKIKYYRKKKVSRRIKYYKVYRNGEPTTKKWQRLRPVKRNTIRNADKTNELKQESYTPREEKIYRMKNG